MWRRGEWVYALFVFLVLLLEGLALGGLVWAATSRFFRLVEASWLGAALLLALALTGIALLFLSVYLLLYHAYSAVREIRERQAQEAWVERFTLALLGEDPPPPPWPKPAWRALLELRERLKGAYGEVLAGWIRQGNPPWPRMLLGRFYTPLSRLEALEALAQARLPEHLPLVLDYLKHPDPVFRMAAARAAARMAPPEETGALAQALVEAGLSRGVLLEALLLMEDRVGPAVRYLLQNGRPEERWAALEAIGRLKLLDLAPLAEARLEDPDPEVQAAALRALYRLGYPPLDRLDQILALLQAEKEGLRIQAARLLGLFPGHWPRRFLWKALADPSFFVRRAAAEGLFRADPKALAEAARAHPDPYGRAMAGQVWREARLDLGQEGG